MDDDVAQLRRRIAELEEEAARSRRVHGAIFQVHGRLGPATGLRYLKLLVENLSDVLGMGYAQVATLMEGGGRVRTDAVFCDGEFLDDFEYPLSGTPCDDVTQRGVCAYAAGVQQMFPDDAALRELGAECYVGVPLIGSAGQVLGLIAVLDRKPLPHPDELPRVLQAFAWRAAVEIERVRGEEALERSQATARAMRDAIPDLVFRLDASGTYLDFKPSKEFLSRITPEEVVGRTMGEFLPPRHLTPVMHYIRRTLETRSLQVFHLQVRQNGVMRRLEIRMAPSDVEEVIAFARDVTERSELEAELQHTQKLESLGILAGGIAHDFNNLLVGVLGNVSLALDEVADGSPLRPILTEVESAAERAAELTHQLLAYCGKARFSFTSLCPSHLVEELLPLLRTSVQGRVPLETHLARALPQVRGDAGQLRQVLMNLVINSAESSASKKAPVRLATGTRRFLRDELDRAVLGVDLPEGDFVFIEVSDRGCGMDRTLVSRIFDPFFTTKATGRGLGLASVLGIVRSHRGGILVESEQGQGSRFCLLLPPASGEAEPPEPPSPVPVPKASGRATVLVIDDESVVRKLARATLERAGFRVLSAASGPDGLVLFRTHDVDAVLLDLTMPEMSGEETLDEILGIRPDARVVLSSGYAASNAHELGPSDRVAGFLPKPYGPGELLSRVEAAIAGAGA